MVEKNKVIDIALKVLNVLFFIFLHDLEMFDALKDPAELLGRGGCDNADWYYATVKGFTIYNISWIAGLLLVMLLGVFLLLLFGYIAELYAVFKDSSEYPFGMACGGWSYQTINH